MGGKLPEYTKELFAMKKFYTTFSRAYVPIGTFMGQLRANRDFKASIDLETRNKWCSNGLGSIFLAFYLCRKRNLNLMTAKEAMKALNQS